VSREREATRETGRLDAVEAEVAWDAVIARVEHDEIGRGLAWSGDFGT
jgi:hypothetical protein